ncbi:unnamed protein product [Amoebophrya sp. A120]|nr:unnamed protein product [Amoebophrya sp. A120]|eukprot:GSA120T00022386001.1
MNDPMAASSSQSMENVDVTVLAFAQWLSEMRNRTNGNLQQILAEMGIVRNGISSNNQELSDFKRNATTVQQQQQQQLVDLRERLQDTINELQALKKSKAQSDQEIAADYQSLVEQLQYRQVEIEGLKKQYSSTLQQQQAQILQLQTELNEVRVQREETHRLAADSSQSLMKNYAELELNSQNTATELKRTRVDHDQAIANLADNMNRWNDTIRDLSREFHEFQKLMTSQQTNLQRTVEENMLTYGSSRLPTTGASAATPQYASSSQQPTPQQQASVMGGGGGMQQVPPTQLHHPQGFQLPSNAQGQQRPRSFAYLCGSQLLHSQLLHEFVMQKHYLSAHDQAFSA